MYVDKETLLRASKRLNQLIEEGKGASLEAINLRYFIMMQFSGWEKVLYEENIEKPEVKDIKVFQWPFGKHYYAKYKGEDVVVKGEQKWNTYEEAYKKALEYAGIQYRQLDGDSIGE